MEWRLTDNNIASACVQKIQKLIDSGDLRATDIVIKARTEYQAKELFNAWRVYFIDRMMNEYEEQGWKDKPGFAPLSELEFDLTYYDNLVQEEKKRKEGS